MEFEYDYGGSKSLCQGVVYSRWDKLHIWHNGESRICHGYLFESHKTRFRKIGSSDIGPTTGDDEVERIARAYFATAKSFTPDSDKSYAENQAAWVKFHGLKVGDKVKVVRQFESEEDGFGYVWMGLSMKKLIGTTCVIDCIQSDRIRLDEGFVWPYFALEPVK